MLAPLIQWFLREGEWVRTHVSINSQAAMIGFFVFLIEFSLKPNLDPVLADWESNSNLWPLIWVLKNAGTIVLIFLTDLTGHVVKRNIYACDSYKKFNDHERRVYCAALLFQCVFRPKFGVWDRFLAFFNYTMQSLLVLENEESKQGRGNGKIHHKLAVVIFLTTSLEYGVLLGMKLHQSAHAMAVMTLVGQIFQQYDVAFAAIAALIPPKPKVEATWWALVGMGDKTPAESPAATMVRETWENKANFVNLYVASANMLWCLRLHKKKMEFHIHWQRNFLWATLWVQLDAYSWNIIPACVSLALLFDTFVHTQAPPLLPTQIFMGWYKDVLSNRAAMGF